MKNVKTLRNKSESKNIVFLWIFADETKGQQIGHWVQQIGHWNKMFSIFIFVGAQFLLIVNRQSEIDCWVTLIVSTIIENKDVEKVSRIIEHVFSTGLLAIMF